ncbi:MAG: hypothetical protein WC852_04105 [Candidatus Nanoarchaeia archaeon]|jgi:hypothetical protein
MIKYLIAAMAIILLITGCAPKETPPQEVIPAPEPPSPEMMPPPESIPGMPVEIPPMPEAPSQKWEEQGIAIEGAYADAEIVEIGGEKYRMYYSAEPEVPNFKGQVYSAVSTDGKIWAKESGERMQWATFPSVIKLDDGKYRMYYQNAGVIKSALSSDGLSWQEESGTRMDASNNAGLALTNVAAPTVMKIGSEYVMVYRGDINEKYPAEVPNQNTQLFLWAISSDGLSFEKKGIALDSRTDEFSGLLDGCELVQWDNGARLYFWSYSGVYHSSFDGTKFSEAEFDYSTSGNLNMKFYPNPPSDPTLIKISGKWMMYYGQHTKGIYYAELNE